MKPAPFDYAEPTGLAEAVALLRIEDAKPIAGGQSLLPLLALRLARPTLLVDLAHVPGLADITQSPESISFGAMVRHHRLAVQNAHPLVAEAARWIGHTAIRSRGTIGGSLAHADPAAELPVAATVLAGRMHVVGPAGERVIRADDFFQGPLQTALAEGELLTAVDLPVPHRWGLAEVARRHGDFALVVVIAAQMGDGWRLAAGGIGGTPVRLLRAEEALAGVDRPTATDGVNAGRLAAEEAHPSGNLHASASYLRAMTAHLTARALGSASER